MIFRRKIYGRIAREKLVEDLGRIAKKCRTQTVTRKMYKKYGKFTLRQIYYNFGSWNSALTEAGLLTWVESTSAPKVRHTISDRIRYTVLKRDNFRCVMCGASPAIDEKVVLHIDHIRPFSDGGETVLENLQTLCSRCNFGKGTENSEL